MTTSFVSAAVQPRTVERTCAIISPGAGIRTRAALARTGGSLLAQRFRGLVTQRHRAGLRAFLGSNVARRFLVRGPAEEWQRVPETWRIASEQAPGRGGDFDFGRYADEIDIDEDYGDFDDFVEQVSTISDQEMVTRVADGFPAPGVEAAEAGPAESAQRRRPAQAGENASLPSMYEQRGQLREYLTRSEGATYALVRTREEEIWQEELNAPAAAEAPLEFAKDEEPSKPGPKGKPWRARTWSENLSLGPPPYWEEPNHTGLPPVPAHREPQDDVEAEGEDEDWVLSEDDWWDPSDAKQDFAPGFGSERHIRMWAASEDEGEVEVAVPPCMCRDRRPPSSVTTLGEGKKPLALEEDGTPYKLHCNGRPGCKNRAEGPRFARYDDRLDDNGGEVMVYHTAPPAEGDGAPHSPPAWVPPPRDPHKVKEGEKIASFKPERWIY